MVVDDRQSHDSTARHGGLERPQEWQNAVEAVAALHIAASRLASGKDAALSLLADALRTGAQRRQALLLLSFLDPAYTIALADLLVELAISHRDGLLIRQILGRLRHVQAADVVPTAVWRTLNEIGDDDAYRMLADLLNHLGLHEARYQLRNRALASTDPYVRAVGEEIDADDDGAVG